MKSTATLWQTFAVVAVLATGNHVCLAAEEAGNPAKPLQASGAIASVDALGGLVTVQEQPAGELGTATAGQPTSFLVEAGTVISKDQQPLTLADVRVGDAVTVAYATKDGQNVASAITIQSSTGAKSETAVVSPTTTSSAASSVQ